MFRLLGLAFGSVLFMAVIALALGSRSHQPPTSAAKAAVGKKHAGGLSDDFELTRDASGRFHLDA